MSRVTRRHFLHAVGGAAASVPLLPLSPAASPAEAPPAPGRPVPPAGRLVDVALTAQTLETTLDGTPVRLRSYNGEVPGPLLEVRPGDRLRVTLYNELPPYDSSAWSGDHNVPHRLDTTNLHLHGLEIVPHLFQPVGTSDPTAEMIAVRPGESYVYEVQIPDDQPDGLFWYHPHHHGSTVVQAVTGMAGGLVVRGAVDAVPEVAAAREVFLVFNDIGLFPSEDGSGVWEYEPVQNSVWDTLGSEVKIWDPARRAMVSAPHLQGGFTTGDYKLRYYLVNGQPVYKEVHNDASSAGFTPPPGCAPTMSPQAVPVGTQLDVPRVELRPGEVARLRLLNANSDDLMPIVVEGHDLFLIELDGVNVPQPRALSQEVVDGPWTGDNAQVVLAPANRASVLVRASPTPGTYRVVQLAQCDQFLYSDQRVLAEIVVAGEPMEPPMAIPASLPLPTRHYPLIRPDEVERVRNVTFSMAFPGVLNPIVGLDFMINNNVYDERSVSAVVDRGSVEEWHLYVPDAMEGGTEGHPFHVHVNSFELISVGGVDQLPGTIMDTIWVPVDTEIVIRMRFRQWTGKSVYHCHILPHEDTGMMQNFLITDGAEGAH